MYDIYLKTAITKTKQKQQQRIMLKQSFFVQSRTQTCKLTSIIPPSFCHTHKHKRYKGKCCARVAVTEDILQQHFFTAHPLWPKCLGIILVFLTSQETGEMNPPQELSIMQLISPLLLFTLWLSWLWEYGWVLKSSHG